MKRCARCREVKADSEFYRHNQTKSRLGSNCKVCHTELMRENRYGLDTRAFRELLTRQDGRCAICRRKLTSKINVDHDHETGETRGLLCRSCNLGLGLFRDDEKLLEAALSYLTSPRLKVVGE